MRQRSRVANPLLRKWEFETNEGFMADMFLQVLIPFGIVPEDTFIPSYLDFSQIEFRATKNQRDRIEYVYKRFIANLGGYYAIY